MKAKCDIILLSYESPELLKECVKSVLEKTNVNSRLIIVDNASRDPEVARYLREVHGNDTVQIEKVFSERNAGFAGGMNKGIRLSDAPYVCLLNNDCVVTNGWLREMINIAKSRKDIGLVNPQSNTFGSKPREGVSLEKHAETLSGRKGKFVELGHAIGFACLVKREVIDKIGYLDEAYEGVCYEDTDFSVRAQKVGYIAVAAEGSYVFHHEQSSRKGLKGKEMIYKKNRELFEKRWGKLLRVFFFADSSVSMTNGGILEYYENLKDLARQRVFIDLWIEKDETDRNLFLEKDFKPEVSHADIGVYLFVNKWMFLSVLWRVLTKKKKYDAVILKEGRLAAFLRFLRPIHRAQLFTFDEGTRLHDQKGERFDLKDPLALAGHLRKIKKK